MHQKRARVSNLAVPLLLLAGVRSSSARCSLNSRPQPGRAQRVLSDAVCIESPRALHRGEHQRDLKAATSARSGVLAASSAATCVRETVAASGVQDDGASGAVERARHAAKAVLRSQRSPCAGKKWQRHEGREMCAAGAAHGGDAARSFSGESGMWASMMAEIQGSRDDETGERRGPDGGAGAEHALDTLYIAGLGGEGTDGVDGGSASAGRRARVMACIGIRARARAKEMADKGVNICTQAESNGEEGGKEAGADIEVELQHGGASQKSDVAALIGAARCCRSLTKTVKLATQSLENSRADGISRTNELKSQES
ncbi:hypothetical protein B0H13DRAFT_1864228 [Mycena leptocephala]|nr:hypothetical protein B0H13DRAFT_1864228 [Mycena leptocephala]